MEIILGDVSGREIKAITQADFDVSVGKDNDFELVIRRWEWTPEYKKGYRVFRPGGEFGGIIGGIETSTTLSTIAYTGRTWRGMLDKKIIRPPEGEDYKIVSGELNTILKNLVEAEFPGLFFASKEDTGVQLSKFQFERYCTLLNGITKMLESVGYKLIIKYVQQERGEPGYVRISAEPIVDYSEWIELSQDSDLNFSMSERWNGVNHLICLGKGELKDRTVMDLYVQENGTIGKIPYFKGTDEITETYENTSLEPDELEKGGREQLSKIMNTQIFQMDVATLGINVDIGDIVGGRDYITGMAMKKPIAQKILTWKNEKEVLEYELKGNE